MSKFVLILHLESYCFILLALYVGVITPGQGADFRMSYGGPDIAQEGCWPLRDLGTRYPLHLGSQELLLRGCSKEPCKIKVIYSVSWVLHQQAGGSLWWLFSALLIFFSSHLNGTPRSRNEPPWQVSKGLAKPKWNPRFEPQQYINWVEWQLHTYNPGTGVIEAKESGVQGNFWLRNELKANLGYVRCCHKQIPIAASKNILESLSGHISCYIVKYQAIRLDLELSHCNSWLAQGGETQLWSSLLLVKASCCYNHWL